MTTNQINVLPSVLDLILYAGDGVEFRLICTDTDGAPLEVTGEVKAQIRRNRAEDSPVVVDFDVGMTDAYQGIIVLSLEGDQTQELVDSSGKFAGVWDVEWDPSNGPIRTLCQGKVECVNDVTR